MARRGGRYQSTTSGSRCRDTATGKYAKCSLCGGRCPLPSRRKR